MKPQLGPEVELTLQLLHGDAEAFHRFVDLFRTRIFQYSFLMCGHREDAEEVAQETLLTVFEKVDQLREPERVKAWVFQIAKNACLMMRRKSIFAPHEEVSLDQPGPQIGDGRALPDKQVLRRELHEQIRAAIGALPHIYRAVFLLRDVEELSTEETAHILDLNVDAVKTRLLRARRMMRQNLGDVQRPAKPLAIQEQPGPLGHNVRQQMLARYRRRITGVKR